VCQDALRVWFNEPASGFRRGAPLAARMDDPTPAVRDGARLAGATALWTYALTLTLLGAATILGSIGTFQASSNASRIGVAAIFLVGALVALGAAFLALRAGFAFRRGEPARALWASIATTCGLVLVLGLATFWYATVGHAASATASAMVTTIAATLGFLALFLWRGQGRERIASGLFGVVAAVLLLVAGRMTGIPSAFNAQALTNLAVPVGLLSCLAVLALSVGALVWAGGERLRGVAILVLAAGAILLAVAAVATMSDVLGSDPFGRAGLERFGVQSAADVLQGLASIAFGLAGLATLLASLLGLVVGAPTVVALTRDAMPSARRCGKCGTALASGSRFCGRCGTKATA